jgi:hypothetical protein
MRRILWSTMHKQYGDAVRESDLLLLLGLRSAPCFMLHTSAALGGAYFSTCSKCLTLTTTQQNSFVTTTLVEIIYNITHRLHMTCTKSCKSSKRIRKSCLQGGVACEVMLIAVLETNYPTKVKHCSTFDQTIPRLTAISHLTLIVIPLD